MLTWFLVAIALAPVKPAAPITPPVAVKVEKKVEAKTDIFASLFGSAPAKPVAKKGEFNLSLSTSVIVFFISDFSLRDDLQ